MTACASKVDSVLSDSVGPHALQPTRHLCPWDSPGKNTGVSCHFLPQDIFPTQGPKLCFLHWQVNFPLLTHLGSPQNYMPEAQLGIKSRFLPLGSWTLEKSGIRLDACICAWEHSGASKQVYFSPRKTLKEICFIPQGVYLSPGKRPAINIQQGQTSQKSSFKIRLPFPGRLDGLRLFCLQ